MSAAGAGAGVVAPRPRVRFLVLGVALFALAPAVGLGLAAWGTSARLAPGPGGTALDVSKVTAYPLCNTTVVCGIGTGSAFASVPYFDAATNTTVVLIAHPTVQVYTGVMGALLGQTLLPSNCPAEAIFPGPTGFVVLPCWSANNSSLLVVDASTAEIAGSIPLPGYGIDPYHAAWDAANQRLLLTATRAWSTDRTASPPTVLLEVDVANRSLAGSVPLPVSYGPQVLKALDPATGRLLYFDPANASIRAIDPRTGSVTGFVLTTGDVTSMTVDSQNGSLLAGEEFSGAPSAVIRYDLARPAFDGEFPVRTSWWGGLHDPVSGLTYFTDGQTVSAVAASSGRVVGTATLPPSITTVLGGGWSLVPGQGRLLFGVPGGGSGFQVVSVSLTAVDVPGPAFGSVPVVGSSFPLYVAAITALAGSVVLAIPGRREARALIHYRRERDEADLRRWLG